MAEGKEIVEKIRKYLEEKEKLDTTGCFIVANQLKASYQEDVDAEFYDEEPEDEEDFDLDEEEDTEEEPEDEEELPLEKDDEEEEPPKKNHREGIAKILKKPKVKLKSSKEKQRDIDEGNI